MKLRLCWTILSLCCHLAFAQKDEIPPDESPPDRAEESRDDKVCTLLGQKSKTPSVALAFCNMFRSDSCCDPAIDVEIKGYYDDLVKVSELCGAQRTRAHIALQYIFCYACSPKEPLYTNENDKTITLCSMVAGS